MLNFQNGCKRVFFIILALLCLKAIQNYSFAYFNTTNVNNQTAIKLQDTSSKNYSTVLTYLLTSLLQTTKIIFYFLIILLQGFQEDSMIIYQLSYDDSKFTKNDSK